MPKIDELNKQQLLTLADVIIGLEIGRQFTMQQSMNYFNMLGDEIMEETKSLTSLQRITRLGYVVQEIKGEIEIEQAVADYQEPA